VLKIFKNYENMEDIRYIIDIRYMLQKEKLVILFYSYYMCVCVCACVCFYYVSFFKI